jgi:hypothetical protein
MSGDAFTNTQECKLLPQTAIEDCVRARACRVPARNPAQFGQLQFHWGKPPPAADPSTRIFKGYMGARSRRRAQSASPIGNVHGDFHAKAKINRGRSFPFHNDSP